ncbi:MAG: DNA-3-methyladenine glycosylase 2 family protein, partial [Chitinophagaceae bacterium]|nr:DNA-3-methyladenine glycosylase 2 family protein [Chitinophagaceae bacterium]
MSIVANNIITFDNSNFEQYCRQLSQKDKHLRWVLQQYGMPPMWVRPARFSTLVLTILEQQVSLASAAAAYKKLKQQIGRVTAAKIIMTSDEDLRNCYFSRQKIVYVKSLAQAVHTGELKLASLHHIDDTE